MHSLYDLVHKQWHTLCSLLRRLSNILFSCRKWSIVSLILALAAKAVLCLTNAYRWRTWYILFSGRSWVKRTFSSRFSRTLSCFWSVMCWSWLIWVLSEVQNHYQCSLIHFNHLSIHTNECTYPPIFFLWWSTWISSSLMRRLRPAMLFSSSWICFLYIPRQRKYLSIEARSKVRLHVVNNAPCFLIKSWNFPDTISSWQGLEHNQ